MRISFLDRDISADDLMKYSTISYVGDILAEFSDEDIEQIDIPLPSEGIDHIIEYLQGDDPWCEDITENIINIVRYLQIERLEWMNGNINNQYRVTLNLMSKLIEVSDNHGRICIDADLLEGTRFHFYDMSYIYIVADQQQKVMLSVMNYRLEDITEIPGISISFPCAYPAGYLSEKVSRWKQYIIDPLNLIINLETQRYVHLASLLYERFRCNVSEISIEHIDTGDTLEITYKHGDDIYIMKAE